MKTRFAKAVMLLLVLALTILPTVGCASNEPKSFTIGVVSPAPAMEVVLQGFKDGMTERGYVEGQNVTYLYNGPLGADAAKLEAEVKSFVDAKVDLILALATPATVAAQKITKDTGIPVVYTPISDPVGAGFAKSFTAPGGNMTGIRVGSFVPKNLEWLTIVAPQTKKVFAPYNPKDQAATYGKNLLVETAQKFNLETITPEVASPDDVPGVLANIPEDVDAIFVLSDSMMLSRIADFVAVALERKIPLTSFSSSQANAGTLMAYGPDFSTAGKQTAGLADQILKGADAGSLPVEEAEYFLYLNQKTADAIGLTFSDQALKAAKEIIR